MEGYQRESQETLQKLNENITKLRKVSTSITEVKQIDVQVEVENETLTVIIDCGASVDYVNKAWCERKGLQQSTLEKAGWKGMMDAKLTYS